MMSSGEPSGDEDATAQHGQYPSDDELLRYAHAAGRSGLLAIHVMDCAADDALDLESGIHLARGWYALAAIQARQKRAPVPALDDFVFSIDHSSLRFPADLPVEQWKKHLAVFEQAARRDPWRDVAADRIPLSDLRLHADLLCASAGAIADQIRHTGEARWWSPGAAGRLTVNVLRDFRFHGGSALLVLLVGYLGQRYNHPHAPWQAASFDNGVLSGQPQLVTRHAAIDFDWGMAELRDLSRGNLDQSSTTRSNGALGFTAGALLLCFLHQCHQVSARPVFLGVCVMAALFGGRLLADLETDGKALWWKRVSVTGVLVYSVLYGATVDALMLNDSRCHVDAWLRTSVTRDTLIGYAGLGEYLPRDVDGSVVIC